jgi:N-acyl homoserine lactone hydrolase
MRSPSPDRGSISITPVYVADLLVIPPDEHMPVYVHVIEHPEGRVLVDTGLLESHPLAEDMEPKPVPLDQQDFDIGSITAVVNTHLHFDHCGGNVLFAGRPTYVQRRELEDARTIDGYTPREWVDAPGVTYVPLDGDHELMPGVRIVAAPGHTPGSQVVVVETGEGRQIIAGDSAVFFSDLDDPQTEGQRLMRSLDPVAVWLAHMAEPWRPHSN